MRLTFKRTNRIKHILEHREIDNENNYYNNGNNKQKEGKTMVESAVKQAHEVAKRDTPQLVLTQMLSLKITRR